MAFFAGFVTANRDLCFPPEERLLKFKGQIFAQIGAALYPAPPPAAASKKVPKAKKLAEDIAEILEDRRVEPSSTSRPPEPGVSEAIISRTLVGIGQHRVRLTHFLEFLFGIGIVGIPVGMKLQREFPIRALQFNLRAGTGDAQYLVIVTFCVCSQTCPFFLN